MTPRHSFTAGLFLLLIVGTVPQTADAQRGANYPELRQQADRPSLYTDHQVVPGDNGRPLLIYSIRLDYDLLPFRRARDHAERPSEEFEFFSTARLNLDILRERETVTRETWSGTAWARSFEETGSRERHLEGAIATQLDPGTYRLRPQLERGDSQGARQPATQRSRRGREAPTASERQITVPDFENSETGRMILLESHQTDGDSVQARLLNYGSAALYGSDYELMVLLPVRADTDQPLELKIREMRSGSETETRGDPIYETTIDPAGIHYTESFSYESDRERPTLRYNLGESGFAVAIVEIPNHRFTNRATMVTVLSPDDDTPYASRVIQSRWINMPVSLLSLDVAISKLRFMVGEEQARRMQRGSASDRERRFREFWQERDPTPETDYNELMVEYYRRVDRAYDQFTTPDQPGYESDQGRAWILYGEPDRRERRYPTGQPTREIWSYPDRTLTFEATTGFGDFRLIREE